ncbi:MAG: D-alanine--D-alanine ligase [Desulfobacteraceae bacterium]
MAKTKLALLSGGVSSEREVSLNSGNQVFEALNKDRYDITRYDPATDIKQLVKDAKDIDVALVLLHGPYGEDGTVQGLLDLLGIPYQGAGVLGSAAAMNKVASKRLYRHAGIPVPEYIVLNAGDRVDTYALTEQIDLPVVVKPACAGSSVGMTIVKRESELKKAVHKAFEHDDCILVEAYIKGMELTCGVIGNKDAKALPVIEIVPGKDHEFFDYDAKYLPGATEEICPARIDRHLTAQVQEIAVKSHHALFLKGYSRTDMLLSKGSLYVLETNTIPGMTATSLYPQAAGVAGYSFTTLLDELIDLAMEKTKG